MRETNRQPLMLAEAEAAAVAESLEASPLRVERGICALDKTPLGSRWPRAHNVNLPVDVLARMQAQESIDIVFSLESGAVPRMRLGFASADAANDHAAEKRLNQLLLLAFAGVGFEALSSSLIKPLSCGYPLAAEPYDLAQFRPTAQTLRLVQPAESSRDASPLPLFAEAPRFRLDVCAALQALVPFAPAKLQLTLRPTVIDSRQAERLQRSLEHLYTLRHRAGDTGHDAYATYVLLLRGLLAARCGLRIEAHIASDAPIDAQALDTTCLALFGTGREHQPPEYCTPIDLRAVWPLGWQMPKLLPTAEEFERLCHVPHNAAPPGPQELVLGETASGAMLRLSARDRARHIFLIGSTGTGKSTLILSLFQQQARETDGVILLDPHGDLAGDARQLVPPARRDDVIWADAADEEGLFRLNVLQGFGSNPGAQQNFVANGLIRLLSRVLYAGVPEAFGPMFELYFRNALFLLMDAGGNEATLADFDRVFADKSYRGQLIAHCRDEKVVEFWTGIAEVVTNNDHTLNNIAPYIVCKLAQFTGNPLIRRLVCAKEGAIDFLDAMNAGKIVILRMPKGSLGASDTELLAALTLQSIAQAAMVRVSLPSEERRPVHLYIDEFQTCAGGGLAEMLAEARKFGLSLVLANQSLSQVDGAGRHPETGAAALANCANLIAFRVGAPDAHKLSPWFAPDVDRAALCRLPDFHAMARLLQNGRPQPAKLLRTFSPE